MLVDAAGRVRAKENLKAEPQSSGGNSGMNDSDEGHEMRGGNQNEKYSKVTCDTLTIYRLKCTLKKEMKAWIKSELNFTKSFNFLNFLYQFYLSISYS